jgi:KipI family sensor histidine kinase inhibitor
MTAPRFEVIACGDDALRILCGAGDIRHDLAEHLKTFPGWTEIVPGKLDVTVAFDPHKERLVEAQARLGAALQMLGAAPPRARRQHILEAVFGGEAGPDLAGLAMRLRRTEEQIIHDLEHQTLRLDMLGFTPGFAYLTGLDPALVSERLANPRPRVAAGSIGLITGQVGLYALEGPGGWPIVGRVLAPLFERSNAAPFLMAPGDEVVIRRATPP